MSRLVIEPQKDTLRGDEGDATWFVACEEPEAEVWAVIDTDDATILYDAPSRANADEWIALQTWAK